MTTIASKIIYYLLNNKLKILLGILALILSAFIAFVAYLYPYIKEVSNKDSMHLSCMINSVIGIPYVQKPYYKNNSSDITKLTKDEWFSLPYKPREDKIHIEEELNSIKDMPSEEEIHHALSLEVRWINPAVAIKNPLYRKLCPHFAFCQALAITVPEYVLYKPEILHNIIKIAEKPCDYICTPEEMQPSGKITLSNYHVLGLIEGRIFHAKKYSTQEIQKFITASKKVLGCDKKLLSSFYPYISPPFFLSKKYVIIMINEDGIITDKNDNTIDIIIKRKDI